MGQTPQQDDQGVRRPRRFQPAGRPDPKARAAQYDADRRAALATRKLYGTTRWLRLREQQLHAEPLCRICEAADRLTAATVCDHVTPHRGDVDAFWAGPFQSLCEPCHASVKHREERGGRR